MMKNNYKECGLEFIEQKRFPTKEKGKYNTPTKECSLQYSIKEFEDITKSNHTGAVIKHKTYEDRYNVMSTRKIYGPPGTGKTTRLINYVKTLVKFGTPIDKIGYFAFTKKLQKKLLIGLLEIFILNTLKKI